MAQAAELFFFDTHCVRIRMRRLQWLIEYKIKCLSRQYTFPGESPPYGPALSRIFAGLAAISRSFCFIYVLTFSGKSPQCEPALSRSFAGLPTIPHSSCFIYVLRRISAMRTSLIKKLRETRRHSTQLIFNACQQKQKYLISTGFSSSRSLASNGITCSRYPTVMTSCTNGSII